MLKKIMIFVVSLTFVSSLQAATDSKIDPQLANSIEKILARTQELEKEVVALKTELKQLKTEKQQTVKSAHSVSKKANAQVQQKPIVMQTSFAAKSNSTVATDATAHSVSTDTSRVSAKPKATPVVQKAKQKDDGFSFLPRGHTVVSSPYLGQRPSFDASDLIVNISSINQDLRVLQHRQKVDNTLKEQHVPPSQRPLIEFSGKIEGLVSQIWPYTGYDNFGINLETAEIDVLANVSSWATGFISIQYDNAPPAVSPQRAANSRFFLEQGFFMIGNLNKFPAYATMGQFYLPFGVYSSNMISAPLTQQIGRVLTRAIRVGYVHPDDIGPYATAFIYQGDTDVGGHIEGGADVSYKWDSIVTGDVGASIISNLSDSQGMQANGGPGAFTGFGMNAATDTIVHRVPGVDVHAKFGFKKFGFLAEYITAVRAFATQDMTFNGHGATPSALNLEGSYSFDLFTKPASFALGYGQSQQGLALNLAKHRYSGVFNISIWRNTIESLEYRHDVNYGSGTTATGATLPITSAGLGRHQDLLLFQMGVYF